MTVELGVLLAVIAAGISIATFMIGRMKDAEERGALKQRVLDLEKRTDKTEQKVDKILEKLDAIGKDLADLLSDHKHAVAGGYCGITREAD